MKTAIAALFLVGGFDANLGGSVYAEIAGVRDAMLPPGKWLLKRRLDHAEGMLSRGDKPVAEVADECGFESQTHFNRVFKERFGLAPLQYRAQKQTLKPQR